MNKIIIYSKSPEKKYFPMTNNSLHLFLHQFSNATIQIVDGHFVIQNPFAGFDISSTAAHSC